MNDLKMKVAIAMNYIPSNIVVQKRSADGSIVSKCPEAVFIGDEMWVLKDKNLLSEHYERNKE